MVSLSKKVSFHLKGVAKNRGVRAAELDGELSADVGGLLKVIGKQRSNLTVITILDVMTPRHCDNGRLAEAMDEETSSDKGTNLAIPPDLRVPRPCCIA